MKLQKHIKAGRCALRVVPPFPAIQNLTGKSSIPGAWAVLGLLSYCQTGIIVLVVILATACSDLQQEPLA